MLLRQQKTPTHSAEPSQSLLSQMHELTLSLLLDETLLDLSAAWEDMKRLEDYDWPDAAQQHAYTLAWVQLHFSQGQHDEAMQRAMAELQSQSSLPDDVANALIDLVLQASIDLVLQEDEASIALAEAYISQLKQTLGQQIVEPGLAQRIARAEAYLAEAKAPEAAEVPTPSEDG